MAAKLARATTIPMESGRFSLDWEILRDERAGDSERLWIEGRGQRIAARLTRASVTFDVPGDTMARLMRLRPDGTGDSNAKVIERMIAALRAAAERMPAAPSTLAVIAIEADRGEPQA